MRRAVRSAWAAVVGPLLVLVLFAGALPAQAQGVQHAGIVSAVPGTTPNILKESTGIQRVYDIGEVGNRMVVGGDFYRVQNVAPNGSAVFNRRSLFAFDPANGAVDPAFDPVINGVVKAVALGPNGTVFVGGTFSNVNGTNIRNVAQLNVSNGDLTSFRPATLNGAVNDLVFAGGRLYVAGVFTTAATVPHGGLATLNPTTGALDPYMSVDVSVNHNWTQGSTGARGAVGVSKIDVANDRLVAIGNFKRAEGTLIRDQAMVVLLQPTGTVVDPNWRTTRYEPACASRAYDSYVRDVEFSPDGSYFVIVTTGAHFTGTLCDTAARWEVVDQGQAVQPRWISDTGGDTLFSVAVTGAAIYVGGHQRWGNNPLAGDRAGPGAVPRPGIAALDPLNGVPLSWNPGRNPRGVGAEALTATATGLYVGMDTDWIGDRQYRRMRLAHFPLAGGASVASQSTFSLPGTVFMAGRDSSNTVLRRGYDGTTPSNEATVNGGGVEWSRARGGFMVGGELFYGYGTSSSNYALVRRTFDGTTFGPATTITTPYLDPAWSSVITGSNPEGSTYAGMLPNFYGTHLSTVTGIFYWNGRVYYTRSGQTALTARGFSVDSGIIQADSATVATNAAYAGAKGMFLSGNDLYVVNSANQLTRTTWNNGVPGTVFQVVSTLNWSGRALFLGPTPGQPVNQPPTASLAPPTCAGATCTFDASGSSDPDGDPLSYSWNFGDDDTGTDAATQVHTYGADGNYTVTVTVSDGRGGTATTSAPVTVSTVPVGQSIAFVGAAGISPAGSVSSLSVTVPATVQAGDGLVLVLSTNSAVTGAPAGWTQEISQTAMSGTSVAMTTRVFERVATDTDAGSTVTVPLTGGVAKSSLQILAYRGTAATGPVVGIVGAADLVTGTNHTTPTGLTASPGDWELGVWSDKSANARTWTAPSGFSVRDMQDAGATGGEIATLLADLGPSSGGPVGGRTATTSATSTRATMITVLLRPAS